MINTLTNVRYSVQIGYDLSEESVTAIDALCTEDLMHVPILAQRKTTMLYCRTEMV